MYKSQKTCSFCDGEQENCGVWIGSKTTILCCHKCAVGTLPILMADAISAPDRKTPLHCKAENTLNQISAPFWKAISYRYSRSKND